MLRNSLIFLSQSTAARAVVTKTPLRAMSRRFVPGETVEDLVGAVREANRDGLSATGNYLGESVHDEPNARRAADIYMNVLDRIHEEALDANISLKFTQLGQDISETFLAKNLGRVLDRADETDTFIRFDMEGSDYTQRTLDAFEKLWAQGRRNIGVVLQSYLRRSAGDVARMNELGARVRLCKGAYAEPESAAFQLREEVDASFVELMKTLLAEGNYPGIATHDDRMIDATVAFAQEEGIGPEKFEFQMLHGVRRDLQTQLVRDGYNVRAYVPFGEHWYPYLMRRLAERPANMLFFAGSMVKESPLGFLWPSGNGRPS
ncbi:MAG: proline dehydrogenase family protein [Gemmatimonadales bacterium]|jgi:proline dehydrogenase|nr:MAG: proline dehydrogenase family protein [Gemmatimonadales bacterium]